MSVIAFCGACGARASGSFCGACGRPLASAPASVQQQSFVGDLRRLPYHVLLPFQQWFTQGFWREPQVLALVFFALFPLLIANIGGEDLDISSAAWAIGIYFALLWGYVLWSLARPSAIAARTVAGVAAFTAFAGVILVLILQNMPVLSALYHATEARFTAERFLGFVLGVGITEETVKILPVLWLAFKKRAITTPRDAAFYAGVSGLGFGVSESVSYSLHYTKLSVASIAAGNAGDGTYVVFEFLRLISLPFLHCVFTGIAGYFVGAAIVTRTKRTALIAVGIAIAAALHGLYDFFDGWLEIAVAIAAILAFVGYSRSEDSIVQSLQHTP